jgi:hypothetical protein
MSDDDLNPNQRGLLMLVAYYGAIVLLSVGTLAAMVGGFIYLMIRGHG